MAGKKSPKELEDMAAIFRLLSEPKRLAILQELMEGEKFVGEVVDEVKTSQANVSKHLKRLTDAGIISNQKRGTRVFYRFESEFVKALCDIACQQGPR